jgi:MFS family permease
MASTCEPLSVSEVIDARPWSSFIAAMATVAMVLGSSVAGIVNDWIGRRWSLIGSTALFGIAGVFGALAPDLALLSRSELARA